MKIAVFANIASVHTQRWVAALSERGHKIHLVTLPMHNREKEEYDSGYSTLSITKNVRIHLLPFPAPFGYYFNVPWARWLLKKYKPDLLHAHYASGYGTLARLCNYHPYVLSVWGSDVFAFPDKSAFNNRLITKNIHAADWICSTSHFMASRTRNLCPALKGLTVTPFGVDVARFQLHDVLQQKEQVTVGTIKLLKNEYGVDILIRAFATACENLRSENHHDLNRQLRLLIVGTGTELGALKELAHALGVGEKTEFAGWVKHESVPEYLNRIDVFCTFSRVRESFGVSVLEASSCGIPVVVSNMGGLAEVVQDKETGFIVENENVSEAANAIMQLILDRTLREKMGTAGRQYVMENFGWKESVDLMESIYLQVLKQYKDTCFNC